MHEQKESFRNINARTTRVCVLYFTTRVILWLIVLNDETMNKIK